MIRAKPVRVERNLRSTKGSTVVNVSTVVAVSKSAKFAHFILLDHEKRAKIAYFET